MPTQPNRRNRAKGGRKTTCGPQGGNTNPESDGRASMDALCKAMDEATEKGNETVLQLRAACDLSEAADPPHRICGAIMSTLRKADEIIGVICKIRIDLAEDVHDPAPGHGFGDWTKLPQLDTLITDLMQARGRVFTEVCRSWTYYGHKCNCGKSHAGDAHAEAETGEGSTETETGDATGANADVD